MRNVAGIGQSETFKSSDMFMKCRYMDERRIKMRACSYKRLFKKLIDLDMTNKELMEKAKVSKSTFYKMKNGQNVTTDVLLRICNALDCDIEEIVECVKI